METFEEIQLKYQGFSLRDIYLYHCNQMRLRANSGLANLLPNTPDQFSLIRELDLSANFVSVNGFYPLLEVMYASNRLETLIAKGNGLTNDVMIPLCRIAVLHPSLAVIDVSDNPKLSTPAGQALLKLVQKNPRFRRICTDGTLIPPDIAKKIATWTAKNEAAFLAKQPTNARVLQIENLFFNELKKTDADKLRVPVRNLRMCESLRSEEIWGYKLLWSDTGLAPLTRAEDDLLTKGFRATDTQNSGQLDHPQLCRVFYTDLGEIFVNKEDAEFAKLFSRLDADEDGLVSLDEAKLILRNHMTYEAVKARNEVIQLVRDNFIIAAEGKTQLTREQLGPLLKMIEKKLAARVKGDEEKIYAFAAGENGLVEENAFVESFVLQQALEDDVMCSVLVHTKKPPGTSLHPPKEEDGEE
eukprot:TRINITY_DN88263_c0_g1_i1.p1 TRINITY_DN88263_c0_g1~~TRINITY_DN88263_c0_g1_i1.p1  ORF type:complete len:414 (-),score=26.10 TRINITY_DN88263_c0_g1_i1:121-1362(-)